MSTYTEATTRYSDENWKGRARAAATDVASMTHASTTAPAGERSLAAAILAGNTLDESALLRLVAITDDPQGGDIDLEDTALRNATLVAWPVIAAVRHPLPVHGAAVPAGIGGVGPDPA
ncbi:MAG: hypothetical protein RLZ55_1791 [Actinomycetota bacterium]|jgi:hypothetical protein